MSDLGLSTLADDQLVELAQSLATELARRNPHVIDAAKAAVAAATARATTDQDALWAKKKWLATMILTHFGDRPWDLSVWRARDRDETRVYLERRGADRRGREAEKYCLYVTGCDKYAPGTVTAEVGSRATMADKPLMRLVLQHVHAAFPDTLRLDVRHAARTDYPIPAEPADVAARAAEIGAA